jgi:hypothetical protein
MSIEAMHWVLTSRGMGQGPKLVLLGLANHAAAEGESCFPGVTLLAGYAEMSERSVQRALVALTRDGWIRPGDQRYVAHIQADRRPRVWELAMTETRRAEWAQKPQEINGVSDCHPVKPVDNSPRGDKSGVHGVTERAPRGDTAMSPEPSVNQRLKNPLVKLSVNGSREEPPDIVNYEDLNPGKVECAPAVAGSRALVAARSKLVAAVAASGFVLPVGDLVGQARRVGSGDPWLGAQAISELLVQVVPPGTRDPAVWLMACVRALAPVCPTPTPPKWDDFGRRKHASCPSDAGPAQAALAQCRRSLTKIPLST